MHGTVLVLAEDPVVAALVGLLLEGAGFSPVFAAAGESPDLALQRLRPLYAVLLDGRNPELQSDLFIARAERMGVRVAVFTPDRAVPGVREWAHARGIPLLALPATSDQVQRVLEEAGGAIRRTGERREEQGSAGEGLTYSDENGRTWRVYDRRGTERRETQDRRAGWRTFIHQGERRECAMSESDFADRSPQALARQFARSLTV